METIDNTSNTEGRPTFLTVLCILTFIGSGLGVLGGLLGIFGVSALGSFAPEGTMIVQLIGLVAAVLCLFGAIKMWGLFKQGFMLYVAGAALSIIAAIISALTINSTMSSLNSKMGEVNSEYGGNELANSMANDMASSAAWTGVIFAIIINVAFVIMYNANKKHLTK